MEESKPAAAEPISLSQAILAPLDAIFKAQIHSARSYINMLWQMAYPHLPVNDEGKPVPPVTNAEKKPYMFPISFETGEGADAKITTVNIPTIALVPVMPLGIEEATIKFAMSVTGVAKHHQIQPAEVEKFGKIDEEKNYNENNRPWYLVKDPVSIRGSITTGESTDSSIEISIKLAKSPVPSALEKAVTILTQNITVKTS